MEAPQGKVTRVLKHVDCPIMVAFGVVCRELGGTRYEGATKAMSPGVGTDALFVVGALERTDLAYTRT